MFTKVENLEQVKKTDLLIGTSLSHGLSKDGEVNEAEKDLIMISAEIAKMDREQLIREINL